MKIYKPALTQPGGQPDLRLPASRNVRKPFIRQPPSLCHLVMAAVGLENTLYPALLWPHMETNIMASPVSQQWPPSLLLSSPMCPPALWRWPARPFDYWNQITEHLHSEPFPRSLCPLEEKPESSPCPARSSGACSPALPSASCLHSSDTDPWLFLSGLPSGLHRGFTWTPFPSRDGPLPLTFITLCHLSLHQPYLPNQKQPVSLRSTELFYI